MKTASRIIGTLMMVAAIGFLAVVAYLAFNENWSTATAVEWEASGILLILASALLLGGRSYLRFDPEAEGRQEPASEATDFLITHRARLKVLAEIGLALSVIRIATAFVHSDWLGIYSNFWLAAGVVVLFYWARKMANPSVAATTTGSACQNGFEERFHVCGRSLLEPVSYYWASVSGFIRA